MMKHEFELLAPAGSYEILKAVIAAGAVVLKDVEAYTVVGGVPAKKIRERFEPNVVEWLEKFQWWNQPEVWIKKNAVSFSDINNFIKKNT